MDRPDEHRLVAYLYGELSEEEARGVEAALEADPHLRSQMDALASTQRLFGILEDPEPPPFVRTRILAHAHEAARSAREERATGWWRRVRWRGALPAAGLVMTGVVAGIAVLNMRPVLYEGDREVSELAPSMPPVPAPRKVKESRVPPGAAAADDEQNTLEMGQEGAEAEVESSLNRRSRPTRRTGRQEPEIRTQAPRSESLGPGGTRESIGESRAPRPRDGILTPSDPILDRSARHRRAPRTASDRPKVGYEGLQRRKPSAALTERQKKEDLAAQFLRTVESEIDRGDRTAARGILGRAVERTRGSPAQGWIWLRWAQLELEDDHLDLAEVYARRAVEVKGFGGQMQARRLVQEIQTRRSTH